MTQTLETLDEETAQQALTLEAEAGIKHPQTLEEAEAKIKEPQTLEEEMGQPTESAAAAEIKDEEEKLDLDVAVPGIQPQNHPRRRKRRTLSASVQQKLGFLRENFNPIPFLPKRALDFAAHEELFRALGLWEFANLDLSGEIRCDLLIELIANYDLSKNISFIHGFEIAVGRSDLARALRLQEDGELAAHQEIFAKDEAKEAILEFLSNYVLMEDDDEDDMLILPEVAVAADKLVRNGRANEIDWAGMMQTLVEKELIDVPMRGNCHYASHLQCLIKFQLPELFEKEAGVVAVPVPEVESSSMEDSDSVEDSMDEDDEDDETTSMEEFTNETGVGADGGLMNDIEDCKASEEGGWVDEGKEGGFEHCLRRCNSNGARSLEFDNFCRGEQLGGEEFLNLERLNSSDILHAVDAGRVSYSPRMNLLDHNNGDFVSIGVDGNGNALVDPGMTGSFFFENNGKRHIENVDIDEDGTSNFHLSNQQKRMRCDGLWDEQTPSGFDLYRQQIQGAVDKADVLYAEKEQACVDAQLQLQYLHEMSKRRDQIIHTLQKTLVEERQQWVQSERCYKHELNTLANLMVVYRKALKETQNKFEEYRKKCPQGDEPLYGDAGGAGGLVLTKRELERLRLEREEEMRRTAEEMIGAFQSDWLIKFEEFHDMVIELHRRLVELDEEVKLVKKMFTERKSKDT